MEERHSCKLVVLGDTDVVRWVVIARGHGMVPRQCELFCLRPQGKSCLVVRFVRDVFEQQMPTVGGG